MTQSLKNSVLALRAQQISESRREFNARGGKMDRCDQCLIATPSSTAFLIASPNSTCFLESKSDVMDS